MAQLTDDCFAFGGPLLAIDDVERLIHERVTPVAEIESVALKDARSRVLAADVGDVEALDPHRQRAEPEPVLKRRE